MKINIKLYGDFKQYAPGDSNQFELVIKPGATFRDVSDLLTIPKTDYVVLVNGKRIDSAFCFSDDDTLVVFPQISGG